MERRAPAMINREETMKLMGCRRAAGGAGERESPEKKPWPSIERRKWKTSRTSIHEEEGNGGGWWCCSHLRHRQRAMAAVRLKGNEACMEKW